MHISLFIREGKVNVCVRVCGDYFLFVCLFSSFLFLEGCVECDAGGKRE